MKTFTGDAWSSDEYANFRYEVSIDKIRAGELIHAMDVVKALPTDLDVNCLRLWDDNVQLYNGDDEVLCDVTCARVMSDSVYWDMKDKYCANVYETLTVSREDLECIIRGESHD